MAVYTRAIPADILNPKPYTLPFAKAKYKSVMGFSSLFSAFDYGVATSDSLAEAVYRV